VLALDRLLALENQLGLTHQRAEDVEKLNTVVETLTQTYSTEVSGVVLSPQIGYSALAHKAETAGPLFALERRLDEPDPLSVPVLTSKWGVEAIRNNYAVAKLELFYQPLEVEAQTKLTMLAEMYDYCQHEGIDLLLELLVYVETTEDEYRQIFPELQLSAIRDVRKYCSLLALEYPLSALGAVTVTAELDVPWLLNCRDTEYDLSKEQLRTCLESGSKGFLALEQFLPAKAGGRAFDQEEVDRFIHGQGRDRVLELARIVEESSS